MPVLHVVDGVLHRLLRDLLDVEPHRVIVGEQQQVEPRGVGADLVDQLVERDERARRACSSAAARRRAGTRRTGRSASRPGRGRSRAPPRRPSPGRRRRGGRRPTRRSGGRTRAGTCRSGRRSPRRSRCAARSSGSRCGPCRRRSRWSGTTSRRRPRRPCPRRTSRSIASPISPRSSSVASEKNVSNATPNRASVSRIPSIARRAPSVRKPHEPLLGRQVGERVAVLAHDVGGVGRDVLAVVAVLGHLGVAAERLEVARLDRGAEPVHLPAGVVEVVLALDGVAGGLEQARDRVAEHGVARVADVQRPRRVRAHELHLDALAGRLARRRTARPRRRSSAPCRAANRRSSTR